MTSVTCTGKNVDVVVKGGFTMVLHPGSIDKVSLMCHYSHVAYYDIFILIGKIFRYNH